MSFFKELDLLPPDPILGIILAFNKDPRKQKVNLGIGYYRDENLEPWILPSVKIAEEILLQEEISKDYLPIDGDIEFKKLIQALALGQELASSLDGHLYTIQAVGGTGALSVGARILKRAGISQIFISQLTWPNHPQVFNAAGFQVAYYPYFDKERHTLDFLGLMASIEKMPPKSAILLQASSHNPTGIDPNLNEWKEIFNLLKKRAIFPFFDFAYQGFGDGIDEDAAALRLLAKEDIEWFAAYSGAKNFGLYSERVGALFCRFKDETVKEKAASQIKKTIRGIYSNPPSHGIRIVSKILKDQKLRCMWEEELATMRRRIKKMREDFASALLGKCGRDFSFVRLQKGMFSYTGLQPEEVEKLINEFGIYLSKDGRINVAGLNHKNIPYVAKAICSVLKAS